MDHDIGDVQWTTALVVIVELVVCGRPWHWQCVLGSNLIVFRSGKPGMSRSRDRVGALKRNHQSRGKHATALVCPS